MVSRAAVAAVCAMAALALPACGKRGNPLPPLQRIPAAPGDLAVQRVDDVVYARLRVPAANVDGHTPADVARVELYALTLPSRVTPLAGTDPRELRALATRVATVSVRPPVEPGDADDGDDSPAAPAGQEPGAARGDIVVLHERLDAAAYRIGALPPTAARTESNADQDNSGNAVRPLDRRAALSWPWRAYFAVAVSPRGRYGPHTELVMVPLAPVSGPPSAPRIAVTERAVTLQWTPPSGAHPAGSAADGDLLPARPIGAPVEPTRYEVYELPRLGAVPPGEVQLPDPLNASPLEATTFTLEGVTFGVERCFAVRAVDVIGGVVVRGPASPVACAQITDTFAPAPARDLVAIAVPGAISLIWEPSDSPDVAGYLVLRAESGNDTLAPVTSSPVAGLSYRDDTTTAGVRYVYTVVAVDRAGNRSAESNRVEETAQ